MAAGSRHPCGKTPPERTIAGIFAASAKGRFKSRPLGSMVGRRAQLDVSNPPEGNFMDKSARNYPLEDIDRETLLHPKTSIADHLKKGPHIMAQARGVR